MQGRKNRARPPLTYDAVSPTARLQPALKNSLNYSRDITNLYANTSIAGFKGRSRTQPADQQSMLMGDINIVGPRIATGVQSTNFNEKVGGPRAAIALTSTAQMTSSFNAQHASMNATMSVPAPGQFNLTNNGIVTIINVAAFTVQSGDRIVHYNSGTVDPGSYSGPSGGAWYIYFDDPTYLGGAVIFKATQTATICVTGMGRVAIGQIKTLSGTGSQGGGAGCGGNGVPPC